jgi:catechol 2,3-dioxygenase-like lactoylglutathione lyase family enzyme
MEVITMKISGIHHVQLCIPANKETEANEFYKNVLGLKEVPKPEALKKNGGMWFKIGNQELHIGVEDQVFKGKHHPAFLVTGLKEIQAHLSAHGITIQIESTIPGFNRFSIRDPFGNRIEFIEPM